MKVFLQALLALGLMKYGYAVSDVSFSEDEIEHCPPNSHGGVKPKG